MTAPPDTLWVDWSPVDDLSHPAMVSAYTSSSRAEAFYHRAEYLLLDGTTMQAAIAAAEARGREQGLREVKDAVAAQANEVWRQFCEDAIAALIPAPPADGGDT